MKQGNKITYSDTKKLFFGEYPYRVTILSNYHIRALFFYASYGGRSSPPATNLEEAKEKISKARFLHINMKVDEDRQAFSQYCELQSFVFETRSKVLFTRQYVQKDVFWVYVYVKTEEDVNKILSIASIKDQVTNIAKPYNDIILSALRQNGIVMSMPYKFKVVITNFWYTSADANRFIECIAPLIEQGEALFTGSTMGSYNFEKIRVKGALYLNDESILSYIALINPKFINKIFPIIQSR